jgi:hypothetical protein
MKPSCSAARQSVRIAFGGPGMITFEDCAAFCGLTCEEISAIAEHEHVPEISAAALAQYMLDQPHGSERLREMIVDDIRASHRARNHRHTQMLLHVLHHFLKSHPEAMPQEFHWSKSA